MGVTRFSSVRFEWPHTKYTLSGVNVHSDELDSIESQILKFEIKKPIRAQINMSFDPPALV